jgi:hypothetical protein
MALTPTITTALDVFHKLIREEGRAIRAQDITERADALYNFCTSSLAMRDFILHDQGIPDSGRQPYYQVWKANSFISGCWDIGNASKHVTPERVPKTDVTDGSDHLVETYLNQETGELHHQLRTTDSYQITLEGIGTLTLLDFMLNVVEFWRKELRRFNYRDIPPSPIESAREIAQESSKLGS